MKPRVVLASTVHDRGGHFLPGLQRLGGSLLEQFGGLAVQATTQTDERVVRHLEDSLSALVEQAPADGSVGLHRRASLGLALRLDADAVVYSDLDHVLRWVEADPGELAAAVDQMISADFVIVGRSPAALARCPKRLRDTERLVNHVYFLATGRPWDLMFAIRGMSRAVAAAIVADCTEDSIANDVEWPFFAEHAGFGLDYVEAGGLSYRVTRDFDAAIDAHDDEPLAWINRLELAALHARAMARFLR